MYKTRELVSRSLVKEVQDLTTYPGYFYVFFKSFNEVDRKFKEDHGERWYLLPWAKVWLYEEEERLTRKQQPGRSGLKSKIIEIYDHFGYDISIRGVHAQLLNLGIKVSFETARRWCKRVLSEREIKNAG